MECAFSNLVSNPDMEDVLASVNLKQKDNMQIFEAMFGKPLSRDSIGRYIRSEDTTDKIKCFLRQSKKEKGSLFKGATATETLHRAKGHNILPTMRERSMQNTMTTVQAKMSTWFEAASEMSLEEVVESF